MCNAGPFHHFLCFCVNMKAAWLHPPYYHTSPWVISASASLLKPCQSARVKRQPTDNCMTDTHTHTHTQTQTCSQGWEAFSPSFLAKYSYFVRLYCLLRWPFPWQFLQTSEKAASTWSKLDHICIYFQPPQEHPRWLSHSFSVREVFKSVKTGNRTPTFK